MTIRVNFKNLLRAAAIVMVGWAVAINVVRPLLDGDETTVWTWITLGILFASGFFLGEFVRGWLDARAWRHYWLCEGYNLDAVDERINELEERTRDAVRSGRLFKNYGEGRGKG